MTAKEKAIELVEKYKPYVYCYFGSGMLVNQEDESTILKNSKQCALIAVNEIIKNNKDNIIHWMPCHSEECGCRDYWTNVKQEINNLKSE